MLFSFALCLLVNIISIPFGIFVKKLGFYRALPGAAKYSFCRLKNLGNMLSPAEAANELAEKTKSEVVQVIGNKFVLFKRNPQDPKIDLKAK